MKKHQKKLIGLAGLGLVVGMTAYAVSLPEVDALSNSYTETVTVRVVGTDPLIDITSPANDLETTSPKVPVAYDYENVQTLTAILTYTNRSTGEAARLNISDLLTETEVDYNAGSDSFTLDLTALDPTDAESITESTLSDTFSFTYGSYTLAITGSNNLSGHTAEKIIGFDYNATSASGKDSDHNDDDTGTNPSVSIDDTSDEVDKIKVCVPALDNYCETVDPENASEVELPFDDSDLDEGWYDVNVFSYDKDGNLIDVVTLKVHYIPFNVPGIPDTGAFLADLNISKTDYLISGLLIFATFVVFSIIFIIKREKNNK